MDGISVNAEGAITITQDRLNELLAEINNGTISITCLCEAGNCLQLSIRSKSQGTVHLWLRLLEAMHDLVASTVKFQLIDRRLEGNPVKAVLFAAMPDTALSFLLKLFALPQSIRVANVGDIYTVDLREWIFQSTLAEKEIMGVRLLDCIKISDVEVEAGRLIVKGRADVTG